MKRVNLKVKSNLRLKKVNHKYMPLGKGKKNIGKNIKKEMESGKSKAQAIAIALSVAKQSKKKKK